MRSQFFGVISVVLLHLAFPLRSDASEVCDFDGDGMSEFVIVNSNERGLYDWIAFNPRTGSVKAVAQDLGSNFSKLIPGNWTNQGRAVAAVVDPVGPNPLDRASWTIKSLDYLGGAAVTKQLGRPGDIIIQGGDYDGNGITDSLILKRTTGMLGLRVNYFLSSYNGNNLGKERLYKALGAPFKDTNFFFSPDGYSDYLAVFQRSRSGNRILRLKPFTDSPQATDVGVLPGGVAGPVALKQGAGRADLLAFYVARNGQTLVVVKNLSGREIIKTPVAGSDGVVVGDFLSDVGWEVAVQDGDSVTILNPVTHVSRTVLRPSGQMVSCVSNQMIN